MNELVLSIVGGGIGAAVISGVFSVIMWKLQNKTKENQRDKDIIKGLQKLMYMEIKTLCKQYIDYGYIYADDLEDLIDMHGVYHNALDGNGYLDSLMKKTKELPIRTRQ